MGILDLLFSEKKIHHWINHRNLYLLGLATIICGLGWSNALMSIGQFILIGNWLIELDFRNKIKKLFTSKLIGLLVFVFILHLIGFLWSDDLSYAIKDSRIKLPLLVLPIIIGSSQKLNLKEIQILTKIYVITLTFLTFVSLFKLAGWIGTPILDKRELSIYISHIRYGLNIAFAIVLLFHFRKNIFKPGWLTLVLASWFFYCLFLFELYTGLICLLIVIAFVTFRTAINTSTKPLFKIGALLAITVGLIISSYFILSVKKDYYQLPILSYDQNDVTNQLSNNGEVYWHDVKDLQTENGVYIMRYIAWEEMRQAWNERSDLPIDGKDRKGQFISKTLLRFLSSKGQKKDKESVSQLTEKEISAIENGIANNYYLHHNRIENRIHKTIYEIDKYQTTGIANGFSLAMRIEFWKTSWSIIKQNFYLGVGTGDIKNAFIEQYNKDQSTLEEKYRRRAHNQFLTFWATFGIIGLVGFILFLFLPLILENVSNLYVLFLLIACLSFLTEDTLETQAGVTFFAFFNTLLLLGYKPSTPD